MAKHSPGPWHIRLNLGVDEALAAFADENYQISGQRDAAPWIAETFGGLREGVAKANAQLIARSPTMLALLEKALPIIEAEAETRGNFDGGYKDAIGDYYTEMRELANEIKAEIDKAYGRETPEPDTDQKIIEQRKLDGLCPHGFGFVEYCPDCTDKEIKAKWSAKEDSHG